MFDFNSNTDKPADVKDIRSRLLIFIREQLKRIESGEGAAIKGLQLFLEPGTEDRHLYEAAIYYEDPNRFRNEEIQKLADDYAIEFPSSWKMDILFEQAPPEAIKAEDLPAALYFATRQHTVASKPTIARLQVMRGEAEKAAYTISSSSGKVCIGRDREAQITDGFLRINQIAFPSTESEPNRYVSRQHAHIEWNTADSCFYLFADEGGIPPRNKTKVLTSSGQQLRLQTLQIGHQLADGDQIVLGESALLLFNYTNDGSDQE